jgi:hypothetical protein
LLRHEALVGHCHTWVCAHTRAHVDLDNELRLMLAV